MTGAVAKKRPIWQAWAILGGLLGPPASGLAVWDYWSRAQCFTQSECHPFLSAPSAGDVTARNMLEADKVLNKTGAPVALEIETKDVLWGDDRVLVYAPVDQKRLLVDILPTKDINETEIFRINQDHVYVVAYPHRTGFGFKDVRLNFYDSQDGLKTSTISLNCSAGSFASPRVDITNPRFDRAKREFSFDFDSDCDKLRHATGDEIDGGDSEKVRSRVRVQFDDALVAKQVITDRGERDAEIDRERRASEQRSIESCVDALARKAFKERPEDFGWVGNCDIVQSFSDSPYAVPRLRGEAVYYSGGDFSETYPQSVVDHEFYWCEPSDAFGAESFQSGRYLALMCPDVTRGEVSPGLIGFKSQIVEIQIFERTSQVAEFRVGCECHGLVMRKFVAESVPNYYSFEIGADKENITVNGTTYRLGSLPQNHQEGEPYRFGRFSLRLSDGGLVEVFGKAT